MALLEVIVTSVEDAVEAARGGAGRLEIVRALDEDGLTPPIALVREIVDAVDVPVRAMVRARNTFDVSNDRELDELCADAAAFAALGVEGIVCGWVRDGEIDHSVLGRVLAAAGRCRVTVHRAFEATRDPVATLVALERHPAVDRVLATGGAGGWPDRLARLSACVRAAPAGIRILAGAGIDEAAARLIVSGSAIEELHVGRAVRVPPRHDGRVSADRVAALVRACGTGPG